MREDVLESMSEEALKRLGKLTGSIIEEHVMLLSGLRQQILKATDLDNAAFLWSLHS